jgi:predicted acyltransferase
MSIPPALGARLNRGEPLWKLLAHVVSRAAALLMIGILMVNGESGPAPAKMGWSSTLWHGLLYAGAILAFCSIGNRPRDRRAGPSPGRWFTVRNVNLALRVLGFALLAFLAFSYRGAHDQRIITLRPFSIRTSWYGILGLIGWAYLVAAIVFLLFRTHRTALLACAALAFALYPAGRYDLFAHVPGAQFVNIGEMLGSHAGIAIAGMLLVSILYAPDTPSTSSRVRFAVLFVTGCAIAAVITVRPWGINKNDATPAWCFWACGATAAVWLILYLVTDAAGQRWATRPLAIAGQNVLLAYLLAALRPYVIRGVGLGDWYHHLSEPTVAHTVARSLGCAAVILILTALLNFAGFRVRL